MSSFSPPALRWVGVCGAACGGFLLCLFLRRLRFSTSFPTAGYPSGSICLSCSCGGAVSVLFGRLRFCAAPLPQITLRGFCFCLPGCCSGGVGWAAAFSLVFSVLLLRRLACRCLVFCTLCRGSATEIFTSLCMAVWWCPPARRAFRALFVGLSGLPFFRVGVLLACSVWGPRWLRCLCSLCSFSLLGLLLLCLLVLLRLWRGGLFSRSLLLPPAAPGGCAPLVFLRRLSVPLPSCHTLSFCCFSPGFHPLAFVQAWVGRLRSCLGSSLLLVGALLPLFLFSLGCSTCFVVQVPRISRTLCWGFLPSLPVFAVGSGCLADSPWLSALSCLALGGGGGGGGVVLPCFSVRSLLSCPSRAVVPLGS